MAAYVVVQALEISDCEALSRYAQLVGLTIQQNEGRVLAGRGVEVLEGELQPVSMFIIQFPSTEQVQGWYQSEEYREPKRLRQQSSKMNRFIVPSL